MFLLMFICCNSFAKAQMSAIPADQSTSTAGIADYVKKYFDNDREKLRAIYTWVTSNIKYDTDSVNIINLGTDPEAKITAALPRRQSATHLGISYIAFLVSSLRQSTQPLQ